MHNTYPKYPDPSKLAILRTRTPALGSNPSIIGGSLLILRVDKINRHEQVVSMEMRYQTDGIPVPTKELSELVNHRP